MGSMRFMVKALAVLALIPGASAHQVPAPPSAQRLVGTWHVDRRQFSDDQDVWRRRVDALPVAPGVAAPIVNPRPQDPLSSSPVDVGNGLEIALLRTAMRDLLETAERLEFQVAPGSVTITDDLERTRTYATTGKKEKRQFAATEFDVKTRWNGQALTQEITVSSFAMTEVYLPKEDGRELLVSIAIAKPEFQPRIKDIARVYVRVK